MEKIKNFFKNTPLIEKSLEGVGRALFLTNGIVVSMLGLESLLINPQRPDLSFSLIVVGLITAIPTILRLLEKNN